MSDVSGGRAVRSNIRLALTTLVATAILGGGAGLGAVSVIDQHLNAVTDRLSPLDAANGAALQALTDAETGERGYQLTADPVFLQPYYYGMRQYPLAIHRAMDLAPDQTGRLLLSAENRAAQRWIATYAERVVAAHGVQPLTRMEANVAAGKVLFDRIREANAAVQSYVSGAIQKERSNSRRAERGSYLVLAFIILSSIGLAVAASRRVSNSIVAPLERLAATLDRLTGGDRTVRVAENGPVEIRAVARALNHMASEGESRSVEQERRARLRNLTAKTARHIREHLELQPLMDESVATIGEAVGCDRVTIRLSRNGTLGPVAADWSSQRVSPLGDGAAGAPSSWVTFLAKVAARGSTYVAEDIHTTPPLRDDPEILSYMDSEGVKGVVICPLRDGEEILGTLAIMQLTDVRAWDGADLAMVEEVASDLSRSVMHSQLYAKQLELVSDLYELDKAKTDFLSTVSHELRTPLTSITGYVELLSEGEAGPVSDEQRKMLGVVERNATRLRDLIEDLLTLSRMESQEFRVHTGPVRIAEVIHHAVASVAPSAIRKGLSLQISDCDEGVVVRADSGQLERAVLNLLSNAIKFTPAGGSVAVRLSRRGPDAELAITDTGIGIPSEDRPKLFSRFYRASNAVEGAIPGTGLGLTIVRTIVEQHRGELEMHSAVGIGTTFKIRLPLLTGEAIPAA